MTRLTVTGPFTRKDQLKANVANKFIGRGSPRSSTAQYAHDFGALANCGRYTESDVIFISVEGARTGRLPLDKQEVQKAVAQRAAFIADRMVDRERPYNIGERELAGVLRSHGYRPSETPYFTRWDPP